MTLSSPGLREGKVLELAEQYAREGFEVVVQPDAHLFPFDLDGYRPDLLVRKDEDHRMIAVKTPQNPGSVDRAIALAQEVRRYPGWKFLVVPVSDVGPDGLPLDTEALLTWEQIRDRTGRAERMLAQKEPEAAFLLLWATFEGLLRKQSEAVAFPFERLPAAALIAQMYSQGVLTREQYERARAVLQVRNRVIHGFQASNVGEAVPPLLWLVKELLGEWAAGRRAA